MNSLRRQPSRRGHLSSWCNDKVSGEEIQPLGKLAAFGPGQTLSLRTMYRSLEQHYPVKKGLHQQTGCAAISMRAFAGSRTRVCWFARLPILFWYRSSFWLYVAPSCRQPSAGAVNMKTTCTTTRIQPRRVGIGCLSWACLLCVSVYAGDVACHSRRSRLQFKLWMFAFRLAEWIVHWSSPLLQRSRAYPESLWFGGGGLRGVVAEGKGAFELCPSMPVCCSVLRMLRLYDRGLLDNLGLRRAVSATKSDNQTVLSFGAPRVGKTFLAKVSYGPSE